MKSPSSMTIDSTAAEPKRKTTASEKEKEKENDVAIVVSRNSRKRSSAAISHRSSGAVGVVTPPRPSSSASGGGNNTQVDGESKVASSPPSASPPPLVDLLNIDHFSIICLSLFNEMIPVELQKFGLKIVGLCDTYTKNDGKMYFDLKEGGTFIQRIEKNKDVFKALIDEYCPPLSALVTILESNGCLLNLYPLLLLGELHMHADRKIQYPVVGVIERWCLNITDKVMKLQQQGNRDNHVVFPCDHGNFVCMSDIARGIVEIADGVRLQHGCPKAVMETVGSRASITIVMDLCFGSKAAKPEVLKQLFSRFSSAVPSDSNSIRTLKEVATATATAVAVAPRPSILLHDIDPNGILKDAIDEKASDLITTCALGNKECCVEDCNDPRFRRNPAVRYCKRHSDPKSRCRHCNRGLPVGNETNLCSICYLLFNKECYVIDCKKPRTGASYCKKHSNPFTRCRKCNRGLPNGNETNLCSICYLLFNKECYVIDCNEPRTGASYCKKQ